MILTGKDGVLRIYDSALVIHGAAPLDSLTLDVVRYDGAAWSNITTNVEADDANVESNFIADDGDIIYIGSTEKFAMVQYLKGNGADYAVGSGAMIGKYFNGTDFSEALSGINDGTSTGGNCFGQDGNVSFQIPRDWATGANAWNANLDSDKYYISLKSSTSPSTDPDADVLAPVDSQYFEVKFISMDFDGPIGRPTQNETLVLNRARMDAAAHYIKGPDDVIYTPLPISFTCLIDDTYNHDNVFLALECGNVNYGTWNATGTSTKGDTQNDGSNDNPAFTDANKKTVNVQVLWTGDSPLGFAYYECYFPGPDSTITEANEGNTLAARAGVYGVIERIYGFGNRYT